MFAETWSAQQHSSLPPLKMDLNPTASEWRKKKLIKTEWEEPFFFFFFLSPEVENPQMHRDSRGLFIESLLSSANNSSPVINHRLPRFWWVLGLESRSRSPVSREDESVNFHFHLLILLQRVTHVYRCLFIYCITNVLNNGESSLCVNRPIIVNHVAKLSSIDVFIIFIKWCNINRSTGLAVAVTNIWNDLLHLACLKELKLFGFWTVGQSKWAG